MPSEAQPALGHDDQSDVEDLASPRSRVIYEVVRQQGDQELERPAGSLFWSGLAGGITITASVIAEGSLRHKLPVDFPLREVISEMGYTLGFLMVILGRMQLFTEQTIVTVLPVMAEPGWRKFGMMARLWGIVFLANIIGACIAAAINVNLHLMSRDLTASMIEVASVLLQRSPTELLQQGIPAGFLVASVAWIRAGITGGELWVVFVLTYAIALGDFAHVVAGGAEAFLLVFAGQTGLGHALAGIIAPALAGNVIGGTGLFAVLAHAQVRQEM